MKNIKYILTSCMVKVEETSMCSYGLACIKDNEVAKQIDDISLEKEIVENAAKAFNEYQLSPEHFEDAVEDIVADT